MKSRLSTQLRSTIPRFGLIPCLLPCLLQLQTAIASGLPGAGDYLQPIRWEDYQAAYTGIQRREIDLNAFKLRDEARFIYGRPGGEDSALLANLHVGNPSTSATQRYIVLEDLDPLLKSISCTDGVINVIFKSTETAKNANDHWVTEIQDSKTHTAIAITNHDGCGSDKDQRHPFLITGVTEFNEDTSTISLQAEEVQWADVLGNSKIEFGQQKLAKPHLFLSRRDTSEDDPVKEFFEDLKDVLTPDELDFENKNITANITTWILDTGTQGARTKLYPNSLIAGTALDIPNVEVDCTNCYMRGSLGLSGFLKTIDWEITDAHLELDILEKVEAVVETNVVAQGDLGKFALPQLTLFDSRNVALPVSFTGINIKGILEVGPAVSIGLGLEFTLGANINLTTGITTGINKGAKITLDLLDSANTGVKNWDFTWDPSFSAENIEASITADAFVETSLEFAVKILGGKDGKFKKLKPMEISAGLKLKAPHLSTEFTIGYNGDGFCDGKEAKTGVSAEPSVKAGLDFVVSKQMAGEKTQTILYEKPDIFVFEKELPELCIPFEFSTSKRIELQAKYEAEKITSDVKNVIEEGKEKLGKVLGKESSADGLRPAGKAYALLAGLAAVSYLLL